VGPERRIDAAEREQVLVLVAATIIIWPAVGRMTFLGVPMPLSTVMLVWPLPVYLAMVHGFRSTRIVHPVYLSGIAAMLTMRLVLPFEYVARMARDSGSHHGVLPTTSRPRPLIASAGHASRSASYRSAPTLRCHQSAVG
jgi:hypothetical protein